MSIKTDLISRIFIFTLVALIMLNQTGCVKRVPITKPSEDVEFHDTIIVRLKQNGKEYKLHQPQIEGEYISGISDDEKLKLNFNDIESIVILEPDKKKFLAVFVAIMGTFAVFAVLANPFGAFKGMD